MTYTILLVIIGLVFFGNLLLLVRAVRRYNSREQRILRATVICNTAWKHIPVPEQRRLCSHLLTVLLAQPDKIGNIDAIVKDTVAKFGISELLAKVLYLDTICKQYRYEYATHTLSDKEKYLANVNLDDAGVMIMTTVIRHPK